MRKMLLLAALLAFTTSVRVKADQPADPKAVIEKAIKAAGGEAKLAKFEAETFKGKGKFYTPEGRSFDYTGAWAVQFPDKSRTHIVSGTGENKSDMTRVINGKKLWMKVGDQSRAVEAKDEIAQAKEEIYAGWVTSLLPLKDKAFQLTPLGESKVAGKPAVGVRVSHKGHSDVNLFFDKDTGLLVKSEMVRKDVRNDKEFTEEVLFSDYKEVKGVLKPMKVVINRDGKKYVDLEVTERDLKEKGQHDLKFNQP